jgi:hypothetical protein
VLPARSREGHNQEPVPQRAGQGPDIVEGGEPDDAREVDRRLDIRIAPARRELRVQQSEEGIGQGTIHPRGRGLVEFIEDNGGTGMV